MSKLNGMQIFELLSNVNDNLIAESVAPALLAGGATGAVAGLTGGAEASSAGTVGAAAAKGGFAAWLVRGGWLAVLAGVLVAAGVAVGVTLAGREQGTTPPVDTNDVTTAGAEESESGETTEANETDPLPRLEDFSNESTLALFSAEQGTLSVNEDGELVLEAVWEDGDVNRSSLVFDPKKVMESIDPAEKRTHGAILIKARRKMATPAEPTFTLGTEEFGRLADRPAETAYRYASGDIDYEFFVLDTEYISSLQNGMTPILYLEWVGMEDRQYSSDGRSLTISAGGIHKTF